MTASARRRHRVCPWWLGYVLVSPLRRLLEPPGKVLGPHVQPGMTVVEPGCGMGNFTLPLARMVGPSGKVICVDLQPKMIAALRRRAARARLGDRIVASVCAADDLGLQQWAGSADLAAAMHMVHEVPDADRLLRQLFDVLRPGGRLLLIEPPGHVSPEAFEATLNVAGGAGFVRTDVPVYGRGPAAMLEKPAAR